MDLNNVNVFVDGAVIWGTALGLLIVVLSVAGFVVFVSEPDSSSYLFPCFGVAFVSVAATCLFPSYIIDSNKYGKVLDAVSSEVENYYGIKLSREQVSSMIPNMNVFNVAYDNNVPDFVSFGVLSDQWKSSMVDVKTEGNEVVSVYLANENGKQFLWVEDNQTATKLDAKN